MEGAGQLPPLPESDFRPSRLSEPWGRSKVQLPITACGGLQTYKTVKDDFHNFPLRLPSCAPFALDGSSSTAGCMPSTPNRTVWPSRVATGALETKSLHESGNSSWHSPGRRTSKPVILHGPSGLSVSRGKEKSCSFYNATTKPDAVGMVKATTCLTKL